MAHRTLIIAALVALTACGPARPVPDAGGGGTGGTGGSTGGGTGGTGGSTGGGTGGTGGSTGGGTGGGTGGSGADAGVMTTIAGAKALTFPAHVVLTGVVVTAVANSYEATVGACSMTNPKGWYSTFWVADPANPRDGIFVYKYCTDPPANYAVQVGDVLTLDGFIGFQHSYTDREGYRIMVKEQYDFLPAAQRPGLPLTITKTGTMALPADNAAPAGFGDADGGRVKANGSYAGTRVHIGGPLTLTDARPPAFKRISAVPNDNVYFGFEVSGGVLVNNFKTYRTFTDGGTACDWRQISIDGGADGGARTISFPNGISGVWDTYTHAPCEDGGTASNCRSVTGKVPGTPDANYTYVLYPMDCANDLAGQ